MSNLQDKDSLNVLAAKGYNMAFNRLKESLKLLHQTKGQNMQLARAIRLGVTQWYSALFQPQVDAGMLSATSIAGYRKGPIYIRGSKHIPPASEQLMDCMDVLFQLCEAEENPLVKAVLAHLCLGFIHPFSDGNGRSARFLMNFLFIAHSYSWTVIRVKNRERYLKSLEAASVGKDIKPFARFVLESMAGQENNSI